MPEVAVKTRDQIAVVPQDWFEPQDVRNQIQALKEFIESGQKPDLFTAIPVDKQQIPLARVKEFLERVNRFFGYRIDPQIFNILNPQHLDQLELALTEIRPATQPLSPNIPPNLRELVQIYQSAVEAKAKRENLKKPQIDEYIAKQITPVIIQTGVVKQAAKIQLGFVIDNSQYLENLAAAVGRKPEVVKRLAKMRLDQIIDKAVTTQALTQARLISPDTSQLTTLFVRNLQKELDFDDLLGTAVRTNKNDAKKAIKSIEKTVAEETEKAKPAIEAAAKNLEEHPAARKAAQKDAVAAVKQVDSQQKLKPAKAARLAVALARHPDNPDRQERIIRSVLGATSSQAKVIRGQLAPQINQLAASSVKPNYLSMADPDSIFNEISLHPNRFPRPLVDAVRSGRINDPSKLADAIIISRNLNIPLETVVLSQWGIDAQKLAANLQASKKWLGIIPMGHGVDAKNATIAKLSDLAAAQKLLADSLEKPSPSLSDQTAARFLKTSRAADRRNGLSEFFDQINLFRLPSALSYNFSRFPPLGSLGNAGSSFVSGLRVQSAPIDSFFNFITSAGNTIRQAPSFLTAPLRSVGSAISNTIINPVKTWANTQIKSGLAKAGAWLAKKGLTKAAKDIGIGLVGKGTAALLAQAVPVAGQIAGALMLLSSLGDIGKFLWEHKDKIGIGLGGLYLFGLKALSALINLLGSAAWTLGGAAIGFALGGPIGAAIGGTLGYLIGSGALGSVLSGLGTALGSAAAGLSSFIGALTAPSLVAGLGSTIATAGLLGVGAAWAIQTFFIQPNINSALFVPPDEGVSAPGGGIPPISKDVTCSNISGTLYCFPVAPLSNVDQPINCTHHTYKAMDIFSNSDNAIGPPGDAHLTIVAYIGGIVIWDSTPSSNPPGGYALEIQGDDGRYYYYAHNYSNIVKKGDRVTTGQPIAIMDSTGGSAYTCEHLHFGISTQPDFSVCLDGNGGLSGDCPNYQYFISPSADFQQTLGMSCQDKPQPCL